MKKYLVTLEFRYHRVPAFNGGDAYGSKTITVGVYEDFETACIEGNAVLELLESEFPLHVFPSGVKASKERFSLNGGCFGFKNTLVTDLAYLQTPFSFFAKISELDMCDLNTTLNNVLQSISNYKEWKEL